MVHYTLGSHSEIVDTPLPERKLNRWYDFSEFQTGHEWQVDMWSR